MESSVLVRASRTPNPLAIKMVANIAFKKEGKASFHKPEECEQIPLIKKLFEISGVHQVHVFQNQLTLSHNGDLSFEEIEDLATQFIQQYGENHDSDFQVAESEKKVKKDLSQLPELHRKAEEILDQTIRPGLQADGGDVEIVSVEGNRIHIMYQGACGGCPSALMGTLE
ncbi:MAG: NifU family protein, partial [Bdellovibrionales bacterium]